MSIISNSSEHNFILEHGLEVTHSSMLMLSENPVCDTHTPADAKSSQVKNVKCQPYSGEGHGYVGGGSYLGGGGPAKTGAD